MGNKWHRRSLRETGHCLHPTIRLVGTLTYKRRTVLHTRFTVSSSPINLTSNPTSVLDLLSYHVVSGNFTDQTSPYPNITLGRTLLNDSSLVWLEGNESQVLAWSNGSAGLFVLNNG